MPSTKDMFPKKHLRTADMEKGVSYNLTIKAVRQVRVYDFKAQAKVNKWALFFNTTPKYLILNETRGDQLTKIFGSDKSEDWIGYKVVVFTEEIIVGGKPKLTISITDSPTGNTVSPPAFEKAEDTPKETEEEIRARVNGRVTEETKANKAAAEKSRKDAW